MVGVELLLGTGGARIRVPRDATAGVEGLRTEWKGVRRTVGPRRARPGGLRIRVFGTVGSDA
ncbi:hypothetical protein DSC45_22500 [Streptomyces sp. YIM 130001]|uniref:hypothetical protein n=1 Tax=Streptomyces sp. YIM 130001 TaxID=2259644 RepID=UPI000E65C965|nr:hypothetical protein [Streptomyces sp. YIM 130001]RII13727.1 hypothetical protein DSC45_22500 [Streptomyces sp. YIM 130001]